MTSPRIRTLATVFTAALAAAAGATGVALAAPAPAPAASSSGPVPAVVDIVGTADGFTAPDTVPAGTITMRVRSTAPDGLWLGLVRLGPGVPLARFVADLARASGADPAAGRAVAAESVMFGGAAVRPDMPVSFTQVLSAGTYYLIDYRAVGRPDGLSGRLRPLRVTPAAGRPAAPPADTSIVMYQTADGGRFGAPAVLPRGASVRVTNRTGQFSEAILLPVPPGTTRDQIGAYFAALDSGDQQAPYPFTGGPVGMTTLSPGHTVVLQLPLRPGRYAITTWVQDLRTGHLQGAGGMYELVTVS
jgi:hypothetical protein